METKKCCVFGHRKITGKAELKVRLTEIIENLIVNENVDTFYVGSRSDFDSLCREVLFEQKEKHPYIKRIYVRAEFPDIKEDYENYLLESCEGTYFPEKARNAGKSVYIQRNYEMIDKSDVCIVYFKECYMPENKNTNGSKMKSGTEIAYRYALKKERKIINLADDK